MSAPQGQPESVTGVQLAQGVGHQPAKGFWADAWSHVIRRPAAIFGIAWISIVAFFAAFAPIIASGHPAVFTSEGRTSSPLLDTLKSSDIAILLWVAASAGVMLLARKLKTSERLRLCIALGLQAGITVVLAVGIASMFSGRDVAPWMLELRQKGTVFIAIAATLSALVAMIPFLFLSIYVHASGARSILVLAAAAVLGLIVGWKWQPPLQNFDYRAEVTTGDASAVYTIVPFSPNQSETIMFNRPPGVSPMEAWWDLVERDLLAIDNRLQIYSDEELQAAAVTPEIFPSVARAGRAVADLLNRAPAEIVADLQSRADAGEIETLYQLRAAMRRSNQPVHFLGTDTLGQDVVSQLMHACRLSISIGFVSTGIAVFIGVTVGALMGYFGGWVDLLLYRIVEIFMAIPVLFVLIVAAGVLPRNIYVMMAIIGCFSWTGSARFIRAEFMKLRNADYVQAARAAGLPLRSILFKHMLPNGVTPVLVDASFTIAAAIIIEAILSFLGLGPSNQASWGKLLSNAIGDTGSYMWWLAIFPGGAIFLTALSYNLIGEALRDAIDPKLKKARV